MIDGKQFHGIINDIFDGDVKGYLESEQLQTNCPKCQERENLSSPDGKYNLEINTAKEVFRCWKCDFPKFSGSLGKLIRILGNNSDYELFKSYGGTIILNNENDEEEYIEDVKLPDEFISFSHMNMNNQEHLKAYVYMIEERKITKEQLLKHKIGFCCDGYYSGRIIIPSYDISGELNYFIGRAYRKNLKPPYLNPDANKDTIIFNEGTINWDSSIYIIEGVFEMFSVYNGIPQLGKTISSALFSKLKEKKPPVVIVLDPDAYKNGVELFQLLRVIYINDSDKIKIVKLKGVDDLDEIRKKKGEDEVIRVLRTATELSTDDYIRMRLLTNEYDRY
jgi:DNA primase